MFDLARVLRSTPRDLSVYRTADGVYDLLPTTAEDQGGHVTHYQRDALEFDYFDPPADAATRHENRRLHEQILAEIPADALTVLDVGCGNAWLAGALLPEKSAVISFDIALRNTTEALRRYPAPNHFAVTGDAFDLPFRDGAVDAIVSSEVMEHVPDVPLYLEQLIRVVRPGGTIVISTPYNETIQYSLCIHCNLKTPLHAHLHSFNEQLVDSLLTPFEGIDYRMTKLSNKALMYLRTHKVVAALPFGAWRTIDRIANRIVDKPGRLVITIRKN